MLSGQVGPTNPATIFDPAWEQTGEAVRTVIIPQRLYNTPTSAGNIGPFTVPVTTTQDILARQYHTMPLPSQILEAGTFSLVIRVFENANTNNVTLAYGVRVMSGDGQTTRATLVAVTATGTEFPLSASAATRIVNAAAFSRTTILAGDRIVVELGGRATGPTAAGSFTIRHRAISPWATEDFALTAGLTADLNSWLEFSNDIIFSPDIENFRSVASTGTYTSVTERTRA